MYVTHGRFTIVVIVGEFYDCWDDAFAAPETNVHVPEADETFDRVVCFSVWSRSKGHSLTFTTVYWGRGQKFEHVKARSVCCVVTQYVIIKKCKPKVWHRQIPPKHTIATVITTLRQVRGVAPRVNDDNGQQHLEPCPPPSSDVITNGHWERGVVLKLRLRPPNIWIWFSHCRLSREPKTVQVEVSGPLKKP